MCFIKVADLTRLHSFFGSEEHRIVREFLCLVCISALDMTVRARHSMEDI